MNKELEQKIKDIIKTNETKLAELKTDIAKAEKGGIDVTKQKADYTELSRKVAQLKVAYL
jgi:hypothetical protein